MPESGSCVREDTIQAKAVDPFEVTQVACDQLETVVQRGGGKLEISVIETHPGAFELRSKPPKNLGHGSVTRKSGRRREHTLFDAGQVALAGRRPVSAVVKLADGHGADELILARDCLQLAHVGQLRT